MEIDKLSQKSGIRSEVLREIIQLAKQNNVKRVILFGSRARGDYKERSDIDIAFRGGNSSSFILSVDEETSTLLEFDVIDLDKPVREELIQSIEEEGILIYEEYYDKTTKDLYLPWYSTENFNTLEEQKKDLMTRRNIERI